MLAQTTDLVEMVGCGSAAASIEQEKRKSLDRLRVEIMRSAFADLMQPES